MTEAIVATDYLERIRSPLVVVVGNCDNVDVGFEEVEYKLWKIFLVFRKGLDDVHEELLQHLLDLSFLVDAATSRVDCLIFQKWNRILCAFELDGKEDAESMCCVEPFDDCDVEIHTDLDKKLVEIRELLLGVEVGVVESGTVVTNQMSNMDTVEIDIDVFHFYSTFLNFGTLFTHCSSLYTIQASLGRWGGLEHM